MHQKVCLLIGFHFLFCFCSYGQQHTYADSLELVYKSGLYNKQDKLSILRELAEIHPNNEKRLGFSEVLIKEARSVDSIRYTIWGFQERGNALRIKGDNEKALESYFQAAKAVVREKIPHWLGVIYITIADVYSAISNHNNAVNYYKQAIKILKQEKDSINVANALYNLGDHYLQINDLDSALIFTKESQSLFNTVHNEVGEAYCLGNLGKIYSRSGNDEQGEANLGKAITLLQGLNEFSAICEYLVSMSDIYHEKKDTEKAKSYAIKSLELAKQYGLKNEVSDASLKLSVLYEESGDYTQALSFYKEYITYRDSVNNIQSVQQIADLRTDFEVSKKQKEVDLWETRNKLRIAERNGFVFASLLLAALLGASIFFYTQKVKRNRMVLAQQLQEAEIVHQKELLQSVITSQEAERKRIGMDLHDEVGAALSTLRIKIEKHAGEDAGTIEQAAGFKSDIDTIITNMRNISHSLSPRISGNFGFYDAVFELADHVNRSGKINMEVHFDEDSLPAFTNEQAPMAIYRVLSELISNTLKHAGAKNIVLHVDVNEETMQLHYQDDGRGVAQSSTGSKGMGMQNIESRLGVIGAAWEQRVPEGGGYGLDITVPLK